MTSHILTSYYFQLIASLLKPMEEYTEDARIEEDASHTQVCPRTF